MIRQRTMQAIGPQLVDDDKKNVVPRHYSAPPTGVVMAYECNKFDSTQTKFVDFCGTLWVKFRLGGSMARPDSVKTSHRQFELLEVLRRQGGSARNADIAQAMDVSEETVRRLVKLLADDGKVERLHGGTVLAGAEPGFYQRIAQNPDGKKMIAAAVAQEISDGMCIFLDVGTTTAFVADALRTHRRLYVVTNSMPVAQTLAHHNDNRVVLTGGDVGRDERGTYGPMAEAALRQHAFDAAILSANAVSENHGFLVFNPAEAALSRIAVEQAHRPIVTADHEKFGRRAPQVSCDPADIDLLVTDRAPPTHLAEALKGWGITVRIAKGVAPR